MQSF
jgi:hypothetical protein